MLGQDAPERADAARNRELLICAARTLVDRCGVDAVTMDAVAAEAGVGKGTVFRRFTSREGLMVSVLDASERAFQHAVLAGPAPLGPGAPALERLLAFGRARLESHLDHAALLRAAGAASGRNLAVAGFAAMHVRFLLTELEVTGDLPLLATALLAPLEIGLLTQQVEREELPIERIVAAWEDLVRRVVQAA